MNTDKIVEYFESLISKKDLATLKEEVKKMNEADLAEVLDELNQKEMLLIFRMLPKELSVNVFTYMGSRQRVDIVNSITEIELQEILQDLYFDDLIDTLEEVPASVVHRVLANATPEERKLINEFLQYPEDSAGTLMTIEYVDLKPDWTVRESLDHIKESGMDKETIYTTYVKDKYQKLLGFVSLRTLVTTDENAIIEDIMLEDVIYAETEEDQEDVADKFMKYGYLALPVVDKEHRLCGIITFDDIMDIVEEEATEDFHRMAAMGPTEVEYMDETIWGLTKNRLPWLLVLMISATITGGIITHYDWIVGQYLILSTFIPMITDTGGNAGSQSSTIVIRALATGQIELDEAIPVMWKEFRVGVIAGGVLSLVNLLRVYFFTEATLTIALIVSVTVFMTVIFSKLLGALLPILAKRLNLDPAVMAGSVITTIIDSIVLVIYFTIAANLLDLV